MSNGELSSERRDRPLTGRYEVQTVMVQRQSQRTRRSQPVRVLQVMPGLEVGGGQSNLLRQLRHMDDQRALHHLVSLSPGADMAAAFDEAGVPVTGARYRGVRDLPALVLRLVRLIRRECIDVVQTNSRRDRLPGQLAALITRRPVVTMLRSGYSGHRYGDEGVSLGWRKRMRRVAEVWLDKRTLTHVAAVSADVKADWQNYIADCGIEGGRFTVIHPGVEQSQLRFNIEETEIAEIRADLGIPPSSPVLLNVARMVPGKRQLLLVPTMQRLLKRLPAVHMVIAGDGPLRSEIHTAVREAGLEDSVHLLGMRRDIPALLALCDVFVFPSFREPFGNAPLEALAAGRPVIGFVPSALSEMVHHGKSGLLVPDGDVEALADAAATLLSDPGLLESMGRYARRDVADRFDVQRIAGRMAEIYESVVRR